MLKFRSFHLFRFLQTLDLQKAAPDRLLQNYFKENKALGSKDRRFISDVVYRILRDRGALTFITGSKNLKDCAELVLKADFSLDSEQLPPHLRFGLTSDLWDLLLCHYGEDFTKNFGDVCNTAAPVTIRVNPLKMDRERLGKLWEGKYRFAFCKDSELGIVFEQRYPLEATREFKDGFFEFQDESAQCAVQAAPLFKEDTVLDYCAGSGGKTLAAAHRVKQLFLHDVRRRCLKIADQRLMRAGVTNASSIPNINRFNQKCSVILADVPCSGTGTYRRTPWLKWDFSSKILNDFVLLQREIVEKSLKFLVQGGHLVYMTCSILPEENDQQIAFFEKEYGLKVTMPFYQRFPEKDRGDGFFMACLSQK